MNQHSSNCDSIEVDHPWIEHRPSKIQGIGSFAKKPIPAGEQIIEYLGEHINQEASHQQLAAGNPFIFRLNDEEFLDGNVEWNPARFMNHCCDPNCEAQFAEGRIWIVTTRPIEAGEELTFNYGFELEDFQNHPCRCGADTCVGFIVDDQYFEDVRRKQHAKQSP